MQVAHRSSILSTDQHSDHSICISFSILVLNSVDWYT